MRHARLRDRMPALGLELLGLIQVVVLVNDVLRAGGASPGAVALACDSLLAVGSGATVLYAREAAGRIPAYFCHRPWH